MKELHPKWSDKQARCVLYWQSSVRKKLLAEAKTFLKNNTDLILIEIPEANGVNVFRTCEKANSILERNPKKLLGKLC